MSQGVFEKLVKQEGLSQVIGVDSAGTHASQINMPPDKRAHDVAKLRGYDLKGQRARRVTLLDFEDFDLIVAMDYDNLEHLRAESPPGTENKLVLLMDFVTHRRGREVPDPYFGSRKGFERVLNLVEEASRGLLRYIRARYRI